MFADLTFGLGRFRVTQHDAATLRFDDRLTRKPRYLPRSDFDDVPNGRLTFELLRRGFTDAAMGPALQPVADRPRDARDLMFWQFPCRTEGAAWERHARLAGPAPFDGESVHIYLGLPWATWLDKRRADPDLAAARREMELVRARLHGLRAALRECGAALRVHTVCQHVYWRDWLAEWQRLGITDLWLSHLPEGGVKEATSMRLHPWSLFAVNAEDPARSAGLRTDIEPRHKRHLASFIGTHADHYLTQVRAQLPALADPPRIVIEVTQGWHFERQVYDEQIWGKPATERPEERQATQHYNEVLSESTFSLCPAGAGPNTLRLWESLAVGAVPVLLGPRPRMPLSEGPDAIDWGAIVIQVQDGELAALPERLVRVPPQEVDRRSRAGKAAFTRTRQQQICLPTPSKALESAPPPHLALAQLEATTH